VNPTTIGDAFCLGKADVCQSCTGGNATARLLPLNERVHSVLSDTCVRMKSLRPLRKLWRGTTDMIPGRLGRDKDMLVNLNAGVAIDGAESDAHDPTLI
jgi:hypothetical protein